MADPTVYGTLPVEGLTLERLAEHTSDLGRGHTHDGTNSRAFPIGNLSDVNLTGLADGNVLVWNAGAGEFVPAVSAPPGPHGIGVHTDVSIASLAVGHYLRWTGSAWVNGFVGANAESITAQWTFSGGSGAPIVLVGSTGGTAALVRITVGGNLRWQFGADGNTESGGNVGNDYVVFRYSDTGAFLGTPVEIIRGTGEIRMGEGTVGFDPTSAVGLRVHTDRSTVPASGSTNHPHIFELKHTALTVGGVAIIGVLNQAHATGTNTKFGTAIEGFVELTGSGNNTQVSALVGNTTIFEGASATWVKNIHAAALNRNAAATGSITNSAQFYANAITEGASRYGLYVEDQTGGATANHAIYTNLGPVRFGDLLKLALGGTMITMAGGSGTSALVETTSGGVIRWHWGASGETETGGNAGNRWFLSRFSDAGAFLGNAIIVNRATGVVEMETGSLTAQFADLTVDTGVRNTRGLRVIRQTGATSADLSHFDFGYSVPSDVFTIGQFVTGAGVQKPLHIGASSGVPNDIIIGTTGNVSFAQVVSMTRAGLGTGNLLVGNTGDTAAWNVRAQRSLDLDSKQGMTFQTNHSVTGYNTVMALRRADVLFPLDVQVDGNLNVTGTFTFSAISLTAGGEMITMAGASGTSALVRTNSSGVIRWHWGASGETETGGNAGNRWFLSRFSDAGAFLGNAVIVNRDTGVVEMESGALVGGTLTSGAIVSTADGSAALERTGTSTNQQYIRLANTSGDFYVGVESSVAGGFFTGSAAYNSVLYSNTQDIQLIRAGVARLTVTTAGLTVTGAATINPSGVAGLQINQSVGNAAIITKVNDATLGQVALNAWNTNTTNGNGWSISFRGDTTGVGAASNLDFVTLTAIYDQHDDATSQGSLAVKARNGADAVMQVARFYGPGGLYIGTGFTAPPVGGIRTEGEIIVAGTVGTGLILTGTSGIAALAGTKVGANYRWKWGASGESETGGNAGNRYFLTRFSDAGAFLGNTIIASRVDGSVTFEGALTAGGGSSFTGSLTVGSTLTVSANQSNLSLYLTNTGTGGREWRFISSLGADALGGGFGIYDDTADAYRLSIDPTGRVYTRLDNDVSLAGVTGSLIVGGDGTGQHIAIDSNEIMSKSNATTAGILFLQAEGGDVSLGGGLNVPNIVTITRPQFNSALRLITPTAGEQSPNFLFTARDGVGAVVNRYMRSNPGGDLLLLSTAGAIVQTFTDAGGLTLVGNLSAVGATLTGDFTMGTNKTLRLDAPTAGTGQTQINIYTNTGGAGDTYWHFVARNSAFVGAPDDFLIYFRESGGSFTTWAQFDKSASNIIIYKSVQTNAGLTILSGQTLALAGATVSGTPTWSSNQAITLSTAAQPNVTSVGTLSALTVSGLISANGGVTVPNGQNLELIGASGTAQLVRITVGGNLRLRWGADGSTESGSNAGNNWALFTYGDTGTFISTAMLVTRATGAVTFGRSIVVGSPTGGDKGAGTINVAGDIYKNDSAYTNPDWRFEAAHQGFSARQPLGWRDRSLKEIEQYTRDWFHLPGFHRDRPMGMFDRGDLVLEKVEDLYLHLFEQDRRLDRLEAQVQRLAAALAERPGR